MLLAAGITCLALYQVLARYVFKWPLSWTEELMRYLFCWIILLGIGAVIKNNALISVTLFPNFIRNKSTLAGRITDSLITVAQIIFFILLVYFGWKLALAAKTRLSSTLRLPFFYIYLALPLGGIIGLIESAFKLTSLIFADPKPAQEKPKEEVQ
jgi:TRAP-type C4-dicarboxylate transport system permease small subunit